MKIIKYTLAVYISILLFSCKESKKTGCYSNERTSVYLFDNGEIGISESDTSFKGTYTITDDIISVKISNYSVYGNLKNDTLKLDGFHYVKNFGKCK